MEQLKACYARYQQEAEKVTREASPMAGLLGFGEDPRKDACHMRFYEEVEQWVKDFLAAGPDRETAYQAARWILGAAADHAGEPVYWFMYAAHGLCKELIPLLSARQCAALRDLYEANYPRRDRLPVQKEIFKLLRKGAGKACAL